jgi:hypothetical protein
MRRTREALGLLLAALLGSLGCTSSDAHLKPPKHPEEYNLPPESDLRYCQPPTFPKEVMEDDVLLKRHKDAKAKDALDAAKRFSAGGMGGP